MFQGGWVPILHSHVLCRLNPRVMIKNPSTLFQTLGKVVQDLSVALTEDLEAGERLATQVIVGVELGNAVPHLLSVVDLWLRYLLFIFFSHFNYK